MKKKIIKCSQCEEEFSGGFEYREHWEKEHFYPYVITNGFDAARALADKSKKKYKK